MHRLIALAGAGLLLACSSAPRVETPGASAARASTGLDLFAERPAADVQVLFVANERTGPAADWPGAIFLPFSTFSVERNGIPNELPPADELARSLEAAGVRGDRFLIVGQPIPAGRAYVALDYLGLGDRAALLDGGPAALGTPPAAAAPLPGPATLNTDVRRDMIVDAAWVHARLNDPNVILIDARPPAEFSGETPGEGITRPGHIPGARNLFWQNLVRSRDDTRLRDEAELRRLFEEAGVRPGVTVVAYCRTGGQSSFLYAVARHLGYDVRLYDGSFVDWTRTSYPVER